MFNSVVQRMFITGRPQQVRVVMNAIRGRAGTDNELFDLNTIVQMPDVVAITAELSGLDVIIEMYGQDEEKKYYDRVADARAQCLKETEFRNWSEWVFEHWGGHGNVFDVREGRELGELFFQTGCAPIVPALRVLSSRFRDVDIMLEYVDEGGAFVGFSIFMDGDETQFLMDWKSCDARDLRRRLDRIDDAVDEGGDLDPPPSNDYIN